MAKDFLSDAEMMALEKAGKARAPSYKPDASPDFISDNDMLAFEKSGTASAPKQSGAGQTFLESAGNAALLGNLPQAQAAVGKMMPNPTKDVDEKLKSQGFQIEEKGEKYVQLRDENIKRQNQQRQDNPKAALAGTVAGTIGGAVALSPFMPAAAPTMLARVGQGAQAGAVLGALQNPGDTEGVVNPLQFDDRIKNAAVGGAFGAAAQGLVEGVAKGGRGIADYLRNTAELKATRALGRPTPTVAAKMKATGQDKELGRTLLDEGAIPILGTPGRIGKRVESLKEEAGEKVSELIKSAGDKKVIDTEALAVQILDNPRLVELRKTPGAGQFVSTLEKEVETLASNKTLTLEGAQKLRKGIDKQINFAKKSQDMSGVQQALYDIRTALRDKMDDAIAQLGLAEKGALKSANKSYSNLSKAQELVERELSRNQTNRTFGLTDVIAASGGMATGNPLLAVALGAANKGIRTFGNSVTARSTDALAKAISTVPEIADLARKNPQAFQALLSQVANQLSSGINTNSMIDVENGFSTPKLMKSVEPPKRKPSAMERRLKKNSN